MSSLKPALWLFACLFVVGLAGEAQAQKGRVEKVDWSEYLEPKGSRAKPMPLRESPRPVAKATPAKKKVVAKKAKAGKRGSKAKRTKRTRRR